MANNRVGDNPEKYLLEKRDELMWALSLQDYAPAQIGRIFNIRHVSTVVRILARKPVGWAPKWVKREGAQVDAARDEVGAGVNSGVK